jgi:hypothetical protein
MSARLDRAGSERDRAGARANDPGLPRPRRPAASSLNRERNAASNPEPITCARREQTAL